MNELPAGRCIPGPIGETDGTGVGRGGPPTGETDGDGNGWGGATCGPPICAAPCVGSAVGWTGLNFSASVAPGMAFITRYS